MMMRRYGGVARTTIARYAALMVGVLLAWPVAARAQRHSAADDSAPAAAATWSRDWPDSAWRAIGPASFGGRVDDIEAVAEDPRIIYVGSASGGVFRSTNGGVTWQPVFDAYGTALSIGDIAIAPSDRNVVWVGTGEANNRQTSTWGDGVYRSLDGGTTWQHMGLTQTQSIGRVVIDPHDPNTVFVAAVGHLWGPNDERGLYRTRDGGHTWRKVLGVDENTGVTDVAMAPDGRTLIAATYERRRRAWGFSGGGPGSGLWRSLDGGDSWKRITAGLPSGPIGRIGIAMSESNPNIVYAVIENRHGGVFRSDDRGASWTKESDLDPRPLYFSQIRVDPTNPDHVWLLATFLYTSIDGGKTFTTDSVFRFVHADTHALWIDPTQPAHMMLGTDGGVFVTQDAARHWDYVDNLPMGQLYDISIDTREPYWIYAGVQDNGTFAFPSGTYSRGALTDDQVSFIGYGDGFQVAVDPTNPRLVYTNSQNGRGYVTDLETREERRITPVASDTAHGYRFNWNTAILVSPNDPHTYYYGSNRLLRTTDHGTTWQAISPDLTRNQQWRTLSLGAGIPPRDRTTLSRDDGINFYGTITTISESPKASGTLYVGTDDGNVQMTTDGGAHWTNLTSRFHLPGPRWVSSVLASRHDARTAFVTFDGHYSDDMTPYVFATTDGGASWHSIAGNLPAGDVVTTLAEDPRDPELLFAGTEFGFYWSFDGGRHWAFPGGSLPHVKVDRILVNERTNDLILATYGRGVIILDDIRALEAGDPARPRDAVQLFPMRRATEVYQWRDNPLGARVFRAPNTPVGALITYDIAGGGQQDTASAHIQVTNAQGTVVRDLSGPGTPGMHRIVWDLHGQLPFVPPAEDSGYYGAYRAPYVPAGSYRVTLRARGQTVSQPVQVRTDPHALATPEALRARAAMEARIDSLSRVVADGRSTLAAVDSEYTHIAGLLKRRAPSPPHDSLLAHVQTQLRTVARRLSPGYSSPVGQSFDLLGGLESSSAAPTEAEQRTLDRAISDLRAGIATLNDIITKELPRLRAKLGDLPAAAIKPVRVPR